MCGIMLWLKKKKRSCLSEQLTCMFNNPAGTILCGQMTQRSNILAKQQGKCEYHYRNVKVIFHPKDCSK